MLLAFLQTEDFLINSPILQMPNLLRQLKFASPLDQSVNEIGNSYFFRRPTPPELQTGFSPLRQSGLYHSGCSIGLFAMTSVISIIVPFASFLVRTIPVSVSRMSEAVSPSRKKHFPGEIINWSLIGTNSLQLKEVGFPAIKSIVCRYRSRVPCFS